MLLLFSPFAFFGLLTSAVPCGVPCGSARRRLMILSSLVVDFFLGPEGRIAPIGCRVISSLGIWIARVLLADGEAFRRPTAGLFFTKQGVG